MASTRAQKYYNYVGANSFRLRNHMHLTQERLAELANIEVSFYQRVERARTNLSLRVLVDLAHALKVAPEELLEPAELTKARRGRPRLPVPATRAQAGGQGRSRVRRG
jgi:transcriptional regulator with XRE-family HTH domain